MTGSLKKSGRDLRHAYAVWLRGLFIHKIFFSTFIVSFAFWQKLSGRKKTRQNFTLIGSYFNKARASVASMEKCKKYYLKDREFSSSYFRIVLEATIYQYCCWYPWWSSGDRSNGIFMRFYGGLFCLRLCQLHLERNTTCMKGPISKWWSTYSYIHMLVLHRANSIWGIGEKNNWTICRQANSTWNCLSGCKMGNFLPTWPIIRTC